MLTIYELVTFEHENEHDSEHDLTKQRPYSIPKIYDAKGDLGKRWYVYFSYLNPETGKMKRMRNIYGKANRLKTKAERYSQLRRYSIMLKKLLEEGYSPFDKNLEPPIRQEVQPEIKTQPITVENIDQTIPESQITAETSSDEVPMTVREALLFALSLKVNIVSNRTILDYKSRCSLFAAWLEKNRKDIKSIDLLTKKVMVEFLNHMQLKTSPRNRNNYRTCLSSVIQTLVDNDLVKKNFISEIPILKTVPQRNKTYSTVEHEKIFKYLEKRDPHLLLFIKFISYSMLRPVEACRLRVGDINLVEKTLTIRVKTQKEKTKIIPDILLKDIPDLTHLDKNALLFTPKGIGQPWDAELTNRRNRFSTRFKKVVKDKFKLDHTYGLYSFRHTFITRLYRSLVEGSSPFAAKSYLMQITGHGTMVSLEKYLRDIDAELPKDYSEHLR